MTSVGWLLPPGGWLTTTSRGSSTCTALASGKPVPAGVKTSVWLSGSCQEPGVGGSRCGIADPSTSTTGREKVRRIAAVGINIPPVVGLATSTGARDGGNHVT